MVWINNIHENRKGQEDMIGGGAICMCNECEKKRKHKRMETERMEIEIITSTDSSVQCIHALRQVMDYFSTGGNLSALGHDKKAVIAWFTNRYSVETPVFKLEK